MTLHFDVPREIGAVTRFVGTREHEGRPARVVMATRTYASAIEDVWDAITNPERIPRWFLPISGDLQLGGRYQLQGNAGGTITRCDRPRHLSATWEFGGQVSWLDVRLEAADEGSTRLELEHIAHVPDDMWEQYGPGAVGVGWDSGLLGLGRHLETGASVDQVEAMAWMGSENGRQFIGMSSDDWCRASIDSGTEEAAARAAAARTTAAYTGESEGSSTEGASEG